MKKTYYVVKRDDLSEKKYLKSGGYFRYGTFSEAQQFNFVREVIREIAARQQGYTYGPLGGDEVFIVKVTETPGETRRELSPSTCVDLSKPVVVYNTEQKTFGKKNSSGKVWALGLAAQNLEDATIFDTGNDAMKQWREIRGDNWSNPEVLTLRNVLTVTSEPTITEEVLQ